MSYSFVGFIISCIVIAITPGMTVSLIIANTLKGGLIPGLITVLGGVIAILSMLIILIIGFDVVINSFSFMFFYIQLLGGLYLLYVGAQTIIKRHQNIKNYTKMSGRNFFTQGFALMWSNPKTLIFLGAFIPPFINVDGNITNQLILYGLTFAFIAWISDSLYAIFISFMNIFLSNYRSKLNVLSGISITCIGLWLLVSTYVNFN
jgi:homoserine/homoserine lactone efflux protein